MELVSHAQNFEDVMLWRALKHVPRGLYIDIGAADPTFGSISRLFHDRGWRGIHVEPIPFLAHAIREHRPRDVVMEAVVGETEDEVDFFTFLGGLGISTCDPVLAARQKVATGIKYERSRVRSIRLSTILDAHADDEVHWLKIDVEGREAAVIRSWAPSPVRPWIVVAESTVPMTQIPSHEEWEQDLLALGYRFVYFDGINRFYVSDAHPELAKAFSAPPNLFDKFIVSEAHWVLPRIASQTAPGERQSISRYLKIQVVLLGRATIGWGLRRLWRHFQQHPGARARWLALRDRRPDLTRRLLLIADLPTNADAPEAIAQADPPVLPQDVRTARNLIEYALHRRGR